MLLLFAPVPLIDGHSQAGEFPNIIPGECHIVLIEHFQSTHHIILREAVDVLDAHIVIGFQQGERILAQLVLADPALLRVDRVIMP